MSEKILLGDFQTPQQLADAVCTLLHRQGLRPKSLVEPNCGIGNFIASALNTFPSLEKVIGIDINQAHVEACKNRISMWGLRSEVLVGNIFQMDLDRLLAALPDPVLVLGNPPWITNSRMGINSGTNLPVKKSLKGLRGFAAKTGLSNFDISEWVIQEFTKRVAPRAGNIAMLCKTGTARRVIASAMHENIYLEAQIRCFDSLGYFGISASACLFVCRSTNRFKRPIAELFASLHDEKATSYSTVSESGPISNVNGYKKYSELEGAGQITWRSGMKHDCARVMEFTRSQNILYNGFNEAVCLEDRFIFPLIKSSDLGKDVKKERFVLVTQSYLGEDTQNIRDYPVTWEYLRQHASLLANRRSSIYRDKPEFSVFGIGPYTFADWKVCVSGFYKDYRFHSIGPRGGKPTIPDDTCYFLPCETKKQSEFLCGILNSEPAQNFLDSITFRDAKRPMNIGALKRLDLLKLSTLLECENELRTLFSI